MAQGRTPEVANKDRLDRLMLRARQHGFTIRNVPVQLSRSWLAAAEAKVNSMIADRWRRERRAEEEALVSFGPSVRVGPSPNRHRRALLMVQQAQQPERIIPVTNKQFTIGRGRGNSLQLDGDEMIGRCQCILELRDGSYYLVDNKSPNGTLVDGELITRRRLAGGEEIIIGQTFLRFDLV